jgi:RNA polymerase sigma-70 factor (ECF subfamily)
MEEPHPSDDAFPILEGHLRRFADLLRFARRSHGLDPGDLGELEQEVRIRLWRAQGSSEKISAVSSSYVYGTAMSAAVDLVRSRRRESSQVSLAHAENSMQLRASDAPSGEVPPDLAQTLDLALGMIARSRAVAVRMHLAGYPRDEIGTLLGWSEARTRNLIYRGLSDLREGLSRMGVGPGGVG